jgi:hypothetical protein
MQDAGRNEAQNELRATDVHGVAGIVTTLVTRHDGKMGREQIDNLAFPFVTPLSTHDSQVLSGHSHPSDKTRARSRFARPLSYSFVAHNSETMPSARPRAAAGGGDKNVKQKIFCFHD